MIAIVGSERWVSERVVANTTPGAPYADLLSRFTRKCACQRKRGYITCWAVRFLGIVSEVFLDDANDLDRGHSTGHAGQPVPSRDTEQLIMHQEAIGEAFHPAQTGTITVEAGRVSVPFTVYAGTDFRELAARSADIRLLLCALWASAGRRTNKASAGTRTNKEECKQCRNKK